MLIKITTAAKMIIMMIEKIIMQYLENDTQFALFGMQKILYFEIGNIDMHDNLTIMRKTIWKYEKYDVHIWIVVTGQVLVV